MITAPTATHARLPTIRPPHPIGNESLCSFDGYSMRGTSVTVQSNHDRYAPRIKPFFAESPTERAEGFRYAHNTLNKAIKMTTVLHLNDVEMARNVSGPAN